MSKHNPHVESWRLQVTQRDGGSCLSCGVNFHVIVRQIFPKKNFYDVDSGISLCAECYYRIKDEPDFEWICRSLILDQKFKLKDKQNG